MTVAAVQAFLPLKWSGRKQGQGCKILFPVFGGERTAAKIQTVKGLRVEFFFVLCAGKYDSSLDGPDSRSGWSICYMRKMHKMIEIFTKLCYNPYRKFYS